MPTILAIDSSTDTLSLALLIGSERRSIHRELPRRHHRLLFELLDELLEGQRPADLAFDALCYGSGPGSFTGLRIAVSFVQGLGYSLNVPVVGVSSLHAQACHALRSYPELSSGPVLSATDARAGQLYTLWLSYRSGSLVPIGPPATVSVDTLQIPPDLSLSEPVVMVGSGASLLRDVNNLRYEERLSGITPHALDMLDLAAERLDATGGTAAGDARPDYVQTETPWKKLAEQTGKGESP